MKRLAIVAIGAAFLVLSGSPASAQSPTMYTLGDIYYYLVEGIEATEGDHLLEPPAGAVSGDSRFKTLKEIYEDVKALFRECDALPSDVAGGKRFFCVEAGSWGVRTGTVPPVSGLLKTGQTVSYHDYDDGWYEKGGDYDYTDNGDGTVTDNFTGLIWPEEGAGPGCSDGDFIRTWTDAIGWAEGLTFAGYSDWRLPNIHELFSLIVLDGSNPNPLIDQTYFPDTRENFYWSSTTCPYDTEQALVPLFANTGMVYALPKSSSAAINVRAVRGGN